MLCPFEGSIFLQTINYTIYNSKYATSLPSLSLQEGRSLIIFVLFSIILGWRNMCLRGAIILEVVLVFMVYTLWFTPLKKDQSNVASKIIPSGTPH